MIGDFPIQFSIYTNCLLHQIFLAWGACDSTYRRNYNIQGWGSVIFDMALALEREGKKYYSTGY